VNYIITKLDLLSLGLNSKSRITNYYEYINKQIHRYSTVLETKRQHRTYMRIMTKYSKEILAKFITILIQNKRMRFVSNFKKTI